MFAGMIMSFTITYHQDGKVVGIPDRAITMHDARRAAHRARETRRFDSAVIAAPATCGEKKEIEVIYFDC